MRENSPSDLRFTTYDSDPLGKLVAGRLRLTAFGFAFVYSFAAYMSAVVSLILYALFKPSVLPRFADLAREEPAMIAAALIYALLLGPAIVAFYPWMTRVTGELFMDLFESGVFEEGVGKKHLRDVVAGDQSSARSDLNDPRWTWAAAAVVLGVAELSTITGMRGLWENTPEVKYDIWVWNVVALPWAIVGWYVVCILAAREFAVIRSLYRLFDPEKSSTGGWPIRVRFQHPDKCGGFGRLNAFSFRFSILIALCALGLLLLMFSSIQTNGWEGSLTKDYLLWLGVLVYIVVGPTMFFLTLGSAHRVMALQKNNDLKMISNRLENEYAKALKKFNKQQDDDLPVVVKEVVDLQALYAITSRFPTWPFDITALRRFAALFSSPFVVAFVVGLLVKAIETVVAG